jgi:hypothetical protein
MYQPVGGIYPHVHILYFGLARARCVDTAFVQLHGRLTPQRRTTILFNGTLNYAKTNSYLPS